ncbi:MAG: hypothetical protein M0R73_01980 [Dehalococcoidia bacterium]|nr:hypothetical protein [Dehalococcoidia bacterium]
MTTGSGHPDVFDQIVLVADQRLGTDATEDIFRAAVISGAACARSLVERVAPFQEVWKDADASGGEEVKIGAALLTEFWSGVIAARMLGKVDDRDEVLAAISERFAGGVFGSSTSALEWSLHTFEDQLALGGEVNTVDGSVTASPMTWHYLYWRSRDLLVGDLPLQGRFHPAPDLETWRADRRNAELDPPMDIEGPTMMREILLWGLDAASQHFAALRQAAEQHEAEIVGGANSAGPGDIGYGSVDAHDRDMADGQIG